MRRIYSILILVALAAVTPAHAGSEQEFNAHWHDGKAELDGYKLVVSRYGEEREGTAVMIFVTEPFSRSKHVKVDDASANPDDTFNALKLNLVRDFATGIYDYNTMLSIFVDSDDFAPVKVSFSSAEWCGHVYGEMDFVGDRVEGIYHSYFEDESGSGDFAIPAQGVSQDMLFITLRGLKGDYLEPGQKKNIKLLPSAFVSRLTHTPAEWISTTIKREKNSKRIKVPAGEFDCIVYGISGANDIDGTFYIEQDYPHRIIQWQMLPDVKGQLLGSERLAYWMLNRNGNESYLKKIGIE